MRKNKKLLLASVAAMGALALGVGATSTFAWYKVGTVTLNKENTATDNLTVTDASTSLGDIDIIVVPHGTKNVDYAGSLVYTNRTGRSYMNSGGNYVEVQGSDNGSTLWDYNSGDPAPAKQASMTFDVKIVKADDNSASPTPAQLANVTGTYTVKVTAGGSVKASLTQTTALTTDGATPVYNFSLDSNADTVDDVTAASGALGKAAGAILELMQIHIDTDGSVEYKLVKSATSAEVVTWDDNYTSWSNGNLKTAVQTEAFYYGLEVLNQAAEPTPSVAANSKLTPSVV